MVSRTQLIAGGVTAKTVEGWVRTGRLLVLHRGVYAVGHTGIGREGRYLGAVLACGPGAVLSHLSAADLWALRPWQGRVHVTAPGDRRRPGLATHRTRRLPAADVTTRGGIPVTRPARTLLDLADVLPPRAVEQALAEAQARGLVTPTEIDALRARSPGRRTTSLGTEDAVRLRSSLEARFLQLIAAHDLPRPRTNTPVEGHEVDAVWRDARLVVELDGFAFHTSRRAFERDRARDARLTASGWRVVRLTHRQVTEQGAATAALIRTLLGAARRRGGGLGR